MKKIKGIVKVGVTIHSTLVRGDDGNVYWHCTKCSREVKHKERCPCCGRTIRSKK